jgi:hypothetical protein
MTPHVLAAVLLLQSAAARPVDGFYLGTLTSEARTLEVGVTLKTDGSGITGTCFYFGPSDDTIALKGAMGAGQTIRLSETTSDGKVTGRWAGRIVGDGLAGTWTNARNGKQWAFQLTRADQASPYFDGPARTMDTASGPVAFRMARVPASDHRVPLMTSFRNPQVTNAVNETLMTVANAARCEDEKTTTSSSRRTSASSARTC